MESFNYKTKGTCSREIFFDLDGDTVHNVRFIFGCSGNTQGVARLVEGMKAKEVVEKLKDIDCNGKGTSCPAQLAIAITQAMEHKL